jgi:hypothetical protein
MVGRAAWKQNFGNFRICSSIIASTIEADDMSESVIVSVTAAADSNALNHRAVCTQSGTAVLHRQCSLLITHARSQLTMLQC